MPIFFNKAEKHWIFIYKKYICIKTHDTGRSFEPIFMNFTWLVLVHWWVKSIVFGNNWPNRTTRYRGKCDPKTSFFGFKSADLGSFEKKTYKMYAVSHFLQKRLHLFLASDGPFFEKWSCLPKIFFSVILENIAFFRKIVKWKIFKTSFLTKKVILILVARHPLPLKMVMIFHKWLFTIVSKNTTFFEKLVS